MLKEIAMVTEQIEASSEEELGLVLFPTICPGCAYPLSDESPIQLVRLDRKGDKFVASGKISMALCRKCGQAVNHIGEVVPIELKALTCECGGNKFRFTIKSLKAR